MFYSLLCSDIDGTLLNQHKTLSTATIAALQRLVSDGKHFVLASSRMPLSIRKILDMAQLNQPIVAYNGGLILSQVQADGTQEVIFDQAIAMDSARVIEELCQQADVHCSLYSANDWFPDKDDYWRERETRNTLLRPCT